MSQLAVIIIAEIHNNYTYCVQCIIIAIIIIMYIFVSIFLCLIYTCNIILLSVCMNVVISACAKNRWVGGAGNHSYGILET